MASPADPELAAETPLLALAARWEDAERRVRALLAEAIDGDRRALLTQALELLVALRLDAQDVRGLIDELYAVTVAAIIGAPPGSPPDVVLLGLALAARLDRAAIRAAEGSRAAFRTVTTENLDEAAQDAVTALVAHGGARLALGAYAAGVTTAAARKTSSAATIDAVGPDGLVRFSRHGTKHPVCRPLEGQTFAAASAPKPPLHPGCTHYLTAAA